jgi:hypothetical protein
MGSRWRSVCAAALGLSLGKRPHKRKECGENKQSSSLQGSSVHSLCRVPAGNGMTPPTPTWNEPSRSVASRTTS